MMKIKKSVGIICEYNPFHSGHSYQIEEMRRRGYDRVVCVMSGNSVQRGEFAITDKYTRAEMAVCGGADLVLELPFPYSSSSAEFFALAGIRILDAVGVDSICFGSECGSIEKLNRAAEICEGESFLNVYKEMIGTGVGTTKAYFEAYKQLAGEELPGGANDILGVAYLRALKKENSKIEPIVLKREGSDYREDELPEDAEKFPSATMIRKKLFEINGLEKMRDFVPKETYDLLCAAIKEGSAPINMDSLDLAVMAMLRLFDPSKIEDIADAGGGLGEKILSAARDSVNYSELVSVVSGRNYPESRSRRAILYMLLSVSAEDLRRRPSYVQVLGFNQIGREMLAELRKCDKIPFITKPADASELGAEARRQRELTDRCDALFTLALPFKKSSAEYIKRSPYIKM